MFSVSLTLKNRYIYTSFSHNFFYSKLNYCLAAFGEFIFATTWFLKALLPDQLEDLCAKIKAGAVGSQICLSLILSLPNALLFLRPSSLTSSYGSLCSAETNRPTMASPLPPRHHRLGKSDTFFSSPFLLLMCGVSPFCPISFFVTKRIFLM